MSSFTSYCKGKRIPIIGNFELTRKCPFNCVICYNERKSKRELTTAEICGILDQLAEQGCIHINFTGGDPLIRDDFPQIYQYAVNLGIVPSIESELAYFPPSVKDILRTYPPHEINVSLYAIDDNVFQEVTRTSLSAKTVLNNLIDLRELGIYFRVRTPVTKINIGQAGKIARFCRTLGIEYNASTKIFWKQSGDRIDSVRCTPNCIKESSDGDPIYDYLYSITKDLWSKPIVKHSCDTGITDFNISAYGELNFCITFWKPEYNLLNGSFQDAWDNWYPLFRRIEGDYCLGKRYLEMELLVLGEGSILIQASIQPRVCLNMQTKEFVSTKMKACRFLIFAKN